MKDLKINIDQYEHHQFEKSIVIHADAFDILEKLPENSVHSVVTDPPFGFKEYSLEQLKKMKKKNGGVWRIPPKFDGNERSPLPRFTDLSLDDQSMLSNFLKRLSNLLIKILTPGGHLFIASNVILSQIVFDPFIKSGFEFRGSVIRIVRTLRGGDRPKNAEKEYSDVCTLPRGCYEPWGIFRKPLLKGMTVKDCLDEFKTGALRRKMNGMPFEDVIESERTPLKERRIANHPSIKPQSFIRQIVYASLPLGEGIVLDPFIGSGSTIASSESLKYHSIGIERYYEYYQMALNAIPELSKINTKIEQMSLFK